jgi:glyoxylase-like metal-dependent hydrolase (beta-lactamase superfamily II)
MPRAVKTILVLILCFGVLEAQEKWWDKLPRPSWSRFKKITQSQNWFEVYEIQPGIFAIYESGQWEEVISYLIVGPRKSVLFDTGLGIGNIKQLVLEISNTEPIVINSHTHYDHVGGNFQFKEIYGTNSEFSEANSKGKSHEEVKEVVSEGSIWKETPKDFKAAEFTSKPFQISKKIQNGFTIELGDRILEVISTPGHSPDSICLLDRKNKLLFTGDTFYPAALYTHVPGSDFNLYAKTAATLSSMTSSVNFLMPAHNETLLPSTYLEKLHQAFVAIQKETARYKDDDEKRQYFFEGFSVLTKLRN